MNKRSDIRSFLAVLLLCVFAFASTPKRYLHDLVTNHNHSSPKKSGKNASVDAAGLSCQYDQLVVAEGFVVYSGYLAAALPITWLPSSAAGIYQVYIPYNPIAPCLRGPPFQTT